VFSGNLSLDMSQDSRWVMNRSGFCGMRSTQIHTENWVNVPGGAEDNTWQAFVFVPKGD
ncbi:hypothetical protein KI387_038242, partial [Taxus chinensis]